MIYIFIWHAERSLVPTMIGKISYSYFLDAVQCCAMLSSSKGLNGGTLGMDDRS